MSRISTMTNIIRAAMAWLVFPAASAPPVQGGALATWQGAPQSGTIEFVARVAPTGGRTEPARQLTFYLLRRSFAEIEKEAEAIEPKPDLNQFIEGLPASKELKSWMRSRQSVELVGSDFTRRLKANDIVDVPEFHEAYVKRNAGEVRMGFPAPKYRESDRTKKPEKYQRLREEYLQALRNYFDSNPQTAEGMEVQSGIADPSQRWAQLVAEQRRRVQRRMLELAQVRYRVAKTDTDLDGRATLTAIAPGDYWLSTLEMEAAAGDVRLRWDAPVAVRAGQATRLELSNINAAPSARAR